MASGDRSKQIRQNVQDALGDTPGLGVGKASRVYDAIFRVQRRIAEETFALEEKKGITIHSGTALYRFPDDMISERKLIPTDQSNPLTLITLDEYDKLKRDLNAEASDSTAGDLFYYYKWAGSFGFALANGGTTASDVDVDLFYWRWPSYESELCSNSRDPVVSRRWDTALYFGALFDITGDWRQEQRYEREFNKVKNQERQTHHRTLQIPHNSSYD